MPQTTNPNRRRQRIHLPVTDAEAKELRAYCAAYDRKQAAVLRRALRLLYAAEPAPTLDGEPHP